MAAKLPTGRLPYRYGARSHRVMVNLNRQELVAWRKAAEDGDYRSMAEFIRKIVNEAINQRLMFKAR